MIPCSSHHGLHTWMVTPQPESEYNSLLARSVAKLAEASSAAICF